MSSPALPEPSLKGVPAALAAIPAIRRFSSAVLCAAHPDEAQLTACARAGIRTVVNLSLHGQSYSLPDEAGHLAAQGVQYVHIPVIWDAPTQADLTRFYEVMDSLTDPAAPQATLVHCVKNMRATAFLALYAVARGGDRDRWRWWIRETWEPDDYPAWAALLHEHGGM
ncbi:protein tyrosine phosphatase family protein [Megalodesulfovibrio paquesii]